MKAIKGASKNRVFSWAQKELVRRGFSPNGNLQEVAIRLGYDGCSKGGAWKFLLEEILKRDDLPPKIKAIAETYQAIKDQKNAHHHSRQRVAVVERAVTKRQQRKSFYESDEWRKLRYKVLKRYGRRCMCCSRTDGAMHVDHIKPRSKYPHLELEFSNMQVLCGDCNLGKSAWDETDWRPDKGVESAQGVDALASDFRAAVGLHRIN